MFGYSVVGLIVQFFACGFSVSFVLVVLCFILYVKRSVACLWFLFVFGWYVAVSVAGGLLVGRLSAAVHCLWFVCGVYFGWRSVFAD